MTKRLSALFAALMLLLGIAVVGAPAASAGTCTVVKSVVMCGRVYNGGNASVRVSYGWPGTTANSTSLSPGYWSPYKDTDGVYIPAGVCFGINRGPFWFKIVDTTTLNLNAYRC